MLVAGGELRFATDAVPVAGAAVKADRSILPACDAEAGTGGCNPTMITSTQASTASATVTDAVRQKPGLIRNAIL